MIDDWSKLIIVNYEGGKGGDFLCELLHKGLNDPSYDICLNDKNRSNFSTINLLGNFKCMHDFTRFYYIGDSNYDDMKKNLANTLSNNKNPWYDEYYKFYLKYKNENIYDYYSYLSSEIKNDVIVCKRYLDNKNPFIIGCVHNFPHNSYEKIDLEKMFPKSIVYNLIDSEIKSNVFFQFLGLYKTAETLIDVEEIKNITVEKEELDDWLLNNNQNIKIKECDKIIHSDLLFLKKDEKYIDHFYNFISNDLKFNFLYTDFNIIPKYREKNIEIICNFFNFASEKDIFNNDYIIFDILKYFKALNKK